MSPDPSEPRAPRRPPSRARLTVLAVMVVANVLMGLFLLGAHGSLAQHERVLDDDTLRSCAEEVVAPYGEHGWLYDVDDVRFVGPNTVQAAFRWTMDHPPRDGAPTSGELVCEVEAGDEIADPLVVVRAGTVR